MSQSPSPRLHEFGDPYYEIVSVLKMTKSGRIGGDASSRKKGVECAWIGSEIWSSGHFVTFLDCTG